MAGRSAGVSMKAWRDLREVAPELFEGLSVMAQPAAVVDQVITQWSLEELGEHYPCSLWQRDLCGGGGNALQSRQVMGLVGQVPSWVLGKMTSAMQAAHSISEPSLL